MDHVDWRRRTKRILLNDTGQMTVFIALIFQVLFVFFAMVINIGLLVHDKINLQNAVDLGAYYGAERQAEILNEIAHVNYQIRQDNKLLAWRYRVLGTLGRGEGGNGNSIPPARTGNDTFGPDAAVTDPPVICVSNLMWREALQGSTQNENYCYQQYGTAGSVLAIPQMPVLAPFLPFVDIAAAAIDGLIKNQEDTLTASGPGNWIFAAQILEAYKLSIGTRKWVLNQLRKNLVSTPDFKDQNAQSVSAGVLQTIKKNLTVSNINSFEDDSFQMINGLATDRCAGPNHDGAPTIVEIRSNPTLLYSYTSHPAGSFTFNFASVDHPYSGDAWDSSQFSNLTTFLTEPQGAGASLDTPEGLIASSLGFEKNPWCMAYIGVHAKTHPRKPFAPFGQPVVLEARAFAQPFGGRVGPWDGSQWSANSPTSSGTRVDPLLPARFDGSQQLADIQRLPNFSRFPGDRLGLSAKAAQAATRGLLAGYAQTKLSLEFFSVTDFLRIPETGDPLAWDMSSADQSTAAGNVISVRKAETVAVAPDLFDITYYSIDSNYSSNYRSLSASGSRFGATGSLMGKTIAVPPDLGGRIGVPGLEQFSIANQVQNASGGGADATLRSAGALSFLVFDIANLLTGWAPNHAQEFSFPSLRFGQCEKAAPASLMIPGGCAVGGRTGYSVRLISRDHLLSKKWMVGGDGESPGAILNPPATDF